MDPRTTTTTAVVQCKFYKIGTCTKGKKCPFVHSRDSTEVVCSFYQAGNCRYGDYCALPHVKSKPAPPVVPVSPIKPMIKGFLSGSSASSSPHSLLQSNSGAPPSSSSSSVIAGVVTPAPSTSMDILTPPPTVSPGVSLLSPMSSSSKPIRDRSVSLSSSLGDRSGAAMGGSSISSGHGFAGHLPASSFPSSSSGLPDPSSERMGSDLRLRGLQDDDDDESLSDLPILPSLLDDLLTPTELLQLSNSRAQGSGTPGGSSSATDQSGLPMKSSAGVFSYSAITKVGINSGTNMKVPPPAAIPPQQLESTLSTLSYKEDPSWLLNSEEQSLTVLEPEGPFVPLEERELLCPFAVHGNCRFGDYCRYVHGSECPVCKKRVLHPNGSLEEHQEHVAECQKTKQKLQDLKSLQTSHLAGSAIDTSKECVVCMEVVYYKKDPRFGIMNCEHCVCLECIRKWRTRESMDTSKTCPICRVVTHFVTPSTVWPPDPETKEMMIEEYKVKLSTIDCRHFNFGEGSCPFGSSCFYRHVDRAGRTPEAQLRVVKGDGEDVHVVGTLKLSDYLERYESSARGTRSRSGNR